MATTQNNDAGGARAYPGYYDSAREYALDHLDSEQPRTPSELADEYGCGGVHMRQTLADLASEGKIERVSQGNYVLPDGEAETRTEDATGSDDEGTTDSGASTASTAELYEQQYATLDDDDDDADAEGGAGSGDPDGDLDGDSGAGGGAPIAPLPADPMKLAAVIAVVLGVWLAYKSLSSGSSGSQSSTPNSGEDQGGADDDLDLDGGLVS